MQVGIDKFVTLRGKNALKSLLFFFCGLISLAFMIVITSYVFANLSRFLCKFCKTPIKIIQQKLMFNSIFQFCIQTYMPVSLSTVTGVAYLSAKSISDDINLLVVVCLLVYCIFLPHLMYKFLRLYRSRLQTSET